MLDLKLIRENAEMIKANCQRRGFPLDIDGLLALDADYRALDREVEELRARRNKLSKECASDPAAREEVKKIKLTLNSKETAMEGINKKMMAVLTRIPNLLAPDVPDGSDDTGNVELRKVGTIREFDFPVRDHQELGEMHDILDIARGAKVAGTGFYYWKGKGAMLAQALYFYVQQFLVKRGFTMFMTPCVAKERTLYGTGYLPFFADQTYNLEGEDLALIGTSEQTLVGYHADDVLDGEKLPLCYTAFTPCFRTESGSYGKASRGIFRVHQFHKVE
ncbi:MAG: serine--tRNA ligase, partial [Lentisphaeria bacterium]|nr:serine--tRNA ligase [Lentisphaeria bacterium]